MATKKSRRYAWRVLYVVISVAVVALGATAYPVEAASNITIDVTVILTAVPCEINNNNLIEVNFGNDVLTTLVDGNYKKMRIPYEVRCPAGSPRGLNIRIEGTGARFDPNVLMTNITNFGIGILGDGAVLPINSSKSFTYPYGPRLEAVPVKLAGATLSGGLFSAGAIMKVEYQ